MKRIGLLGGISHTSTIIYYDTLLKKYFEKRRNYYYPEVIIYSLNFQKFTDYENNGLPEEYKTYIQQGIDMLVRAGAGIVAMAANSPHKVYDEIAQNSPVPMVSIVNATLERAVRHEMRKVLLMGIKFTMQSSFYQDEFEKQNISIVVPEPEEQDLINRIIFTELSRNIIRPESRELLVNIINRYETDGVILGCTELPLIISEDDVKPAVLDTVEIHADKILDLAMG